MGWPLTWCIMRSSSVIDESKKFAVVCNDAGGANLIIAWLKKRNLNVRPLVTGPARRLWKAAYPNSIIFNSLEEALDGTNFLIAGTGWASDLEFQAIKYAKLRNIYSIAVLDHWVNYQDRFVRCNITIYPNEIWVTDEYAYRLAVEEFLV